MPAWDAYKQEAQARGALAFELYVVRSAPTVAPDILRKHLPAHLQYQRELEDTGTLIFAGPLSDISGEQMQGEGMIIYRAASLEQAPAIADADPMHSQGARSYEIRKWMINEGSLHLSIGLSAQAVKLH
ncbi:MAG: YciI family protein [Pseudomonadota bacterium]